MTTTRAPSPPISLPDGRQLVTLREAGDYITKLPKAEHEAPEWQAAMEALILVATQGGATMFARIGVIQALNRHHVREFNPKQKEPHWGRRKLAWMRRYGGADLQGLAATKNWRDPRSAARYAHVVSRDEWDRVDDLPSLGRLAGEKPLRSENPQSLQ